LIEQVAALTREHQRRQKESEERQGVIEHLEAEARGAQLAAHAAHEQIDAIMRTKTYRYASALGGAYTRLRTFGRD
jgi:hypothetical protein